MSHNLKLKKFEFDFTSAPHMPDTFVVEMPRDAKVHTIEHVANKWLVWACVDEDQPVKNYHFISVENGDDVTVFSSCVFITLIRTTKARLFFQITLS